MDAGDYSNKCVVVKHPSKCYSNEKKLPKRSTLGEEEEHFRGEGV